MILRKATLDDKEKIAEVLLELLNIKDIEKARQAFLREINKGDNYIVAEDNGKIIGLVSWLMHGRPSHGLAELYHIITLKESRGKGVGRKLFKMMIEEIKKEYKKNNSNLRKLFLLTRSTNKGTHIFYEKLGFKHETTLKEHFYKDKDEFVFSMFFE